jgi:hypothetical protein
MKLTIKERWAMQLWIKLRLPVHAIVIPEANDPPAFDTPVWVDSELILRFIEVEMADKRRLQESLRIAADHMQQYDPFYSRWMEQEAFSQSVELPPNPEHGTRNTEP